MQSIVITYICSTTTNMQLELQTSTKKLALVFSFLTMPSHLFSKKKQKPIA